MAPLRRRKQISDSEEELSHIGKPSILESIPRPVPRMPPMFDSRISDKLNDMKEEFKTIQSEVKSFDKTLHNISASESKDPSSTPVEFKPIARAFEPYIPRHAQFASQHLANTSDLHASSHSINIAETLATMTSSHHRPKTPVSSIKSPTTDDSTTTTTRRHFRSMSTPRSMSPGVGLDHCKYNSCVLLIFIIKFSSINKSQVESCIKIFTTKLTNVVKINRSFIFQLEKLHRNNLSRSHDFFSSLPH